MNQLNLLAFAAAFGLCLTGCSARPVASDDSRYLTKVVVPKLTAWAAGSAPKLDLAKNAVSRDYDHICFVNEYTSLNIIERNLGAEITDYHSDFGIYVPELKWAVVVVKSGEAHAALGDGLKVNLDLVPGSYCAPFQRAKLIRLTKVNHSIPTARLDASDVSESGNQDGLQ